MGRNGETRRRGWKEKEPKNRKIKEQQTGARRVSRRSQVYTKEVITEDDGERNGERQRDTAREEESSGCKLVGVGREGRKDKGKKRQERSMWENRGLSQTMLNLKHPAAGQKNVSCEPSWTQSNNCDSVSIQQTLNKKRGRCNLAEGREKIE